MLFHARTYADPVNAGDRHHLPSIEVWSEDGKRWHVQYCMPGCLPDSDDIAFPSPCSAIEYCYDSACLDWARLFRFAYQGAINRLRGSIAVAMESEQLFEKLAQQMDVLESEGLTHVEELAQEAAQAVLSVTL